MTATLNPTRDWSTEDNAKVQAKRIQQYWAGHGTGRVPNVWTVPVYEREPDSAERRGMWAVRSDMVGGAPR